MSLGKGIPIINGFDLNSKLPLDSRAVAETKTEMDTMVTDGSVTDGQLCYCKEDTTLYLLKNGTWEAYSTTADINNKIDGKADKQKGHVTVCEPNSANDEVLDVRWKFDFDDTTGNLVESARAFQTYKKGAVDDKLATKAPKVTTGGIEIAEAVGNATRITKGYTYNADGQLVKDSKFVEVYAKTTADSRFQTKLTQGDNISLVKNEADDGYTISAVIPDFSVTAQQVLDVTKDSDTVTRSIDTDGKIKFSAVGGGGGSTVPTAQEVLDVTKDTASVTRKIDTDGKLAFTSKVSAQQIMDATKDSSSVTRAVDSDGKLVFTSTATADVTAQDIFDKTADSDTITRAVVDGKTKFSTNFVFDFSYNSTHSALTWTDGKNPKNVKVSKINGKDILGVTNNFYAPESINTTTTPKLLQSKSSGMEWVDVPEVSFQEVKAHCTTGSNVDGGGVIDDNIDTMDLKTPFKLVVYNNAKTEIVGKYTIDVTLSSTSGSKQYRSLSSVAKGVTNLFIQRDKSTTAGYMFYFNTDSIIAHNSSVSKIFNKEVLSPSLIGVKGFDILPCTSADNGKVVQVVDGVPEWVTVQAGGGDVTAQNVFDVTKDTATVTRAIVDGKLAFTAVGGGSGESITSIDLETATDEERNSFGFIDLYKHDLTDEEFELFRNRITNNNSIICKCNINGENDNTVTLLQPRVQDLTNGPFGGDCGTGLEFSLAIFITNWKWLVFNNTLYVGSFYTVTLNYGLKVYTGNGVSMGYANLNINSPKVYFDKINGLNIVHSDDDEHKEWQFTEDKSIPLFGGHSVLVPKDSADTSILPCTASDNGKVLSVVNGQASWATPTGGSDVTVTFED